MTARGFVPSQRAFEGDVLLDPEVLARVEKPARYLGGEVGEAKKDLSSVEAVVGLCYPDLYEIGMSHIGLKILYKILNDSPQFAAERVYAVGLDAEAALRARGGTLRTLEHRIPLKDLSVLGFTLQYELSYTNLLQVLDLGGIPLRSADRDAHHPIVIAGGPCAFNPEPLAPFLDAVCLGDGEESVLAVAAVVARHKRKGSPRMEVLADLVAIPGVYVPSFYAPEYDDAGHLRAVRPLHGAPARVRKAILADLDAAPYPTTTPVPHVQVVHDRVGVEIQRGCMRGCRFCQAGYIYRPERQRSPQTVQRLVREGLRATGQEEFSLLSLSAGDYNCMEPLLAALMDEHSKDRSAISLPSMRLETLSPGIMDQIDRVRKTSFTVAPEAASDRLRGVINKVIDEDILIEMVGQVFRRGWKALKFYFMIGIPTEQIDDLEAMVELGSRCLQAAKRHNRQANITISVSSFVPKSHTPFQWARQITLDQIRERQDFLRGELKRAKLGFRYHDSRSSVMEGVFSRGDRRTSEALLAAYEGGARMDGWQEHFSEDAWYGAFERTGLDPAFYNQRMRDASEVFPWEPIDIGMRPEWLWDDWMDALEAGFVPDCTTEPCYDCGVCDHGTIHNRVYDVADLDRQLHRVRKPYSGSRKTDDPQFVAMPRPPRKKGTGVVDAVPPLGMAPGSAPARAARAAHEERLETQTVVPHGHESSKAKAVDWTDVMDTRLPVEQRLRVRLRYGKVPPLIYLGHLDVMSTFRRALKRMGAPVLWTQGFHPQMRLSFGPALPTGFGSVCEFVDIELKLPVELTTLLTELRAALPAGLPLYGGEVVAHATPSLQQAVEAWVWRVTAPDPEAAREAASAFLTGAEEGHQKIRAAVRRLREEDGAFALELDAEGARVRDVLTALWGEDAAGSRSGWSVVRAGAVFSAAEAEAGLRA